MAVQKNYVDDKPVDHSAAFAKRMGWSNHQKPPQNGNGSMIGCLLFVCALIALLIASLRSGPSVYDPVRDGPTSYVPRE